MVVTLGAATWRNQVSNWMFFLFNRKVNFKLIC